MSLLSDTMGQPERVWSLCRLLEAIGGRGERAEVERWMMPASFRATEKSVIQVNQTLGAARSLGVVAGEADEVLLRMDEVPSDIADFMDEAHRRLRDEPSDADQIVLEVYACTLVETERFGSTEWLAARTVKQIAEHIDDVLQGAQRGATRLFNSTKFAPWRRWMLALGLGYESPGVLPAFYPQPAERISREVRSMEFAVGEEIPAQAFMTALRRRMPYLDHGEVFDAVCKRAGFQLRPGWLSRVTSEALLDLHDEGVLRLVARADAPDAFSLVSDVTSPVRSFVGVILNVGEE